MFDVNCESIVKVDLLESSIIYESTQLDEIIDNIDDLNDEIIDELSNEMIYEIIRKEMYN